MHSGKERSMIHILSLVTSTLSNGAHGNFHDEHGNFYGKYCSSYGKHSNFVKNLPDLQ